MHVRNFVKPFGFSFSESRTRDIFPRLEATLSLSSWSNNPSWIKCEDSSNMLPCCTTSLRCVAITCSSRMPSRSWKTTHSPGLRVKSSDVLSSIWSVKVLLGDGQLDSTCRSIWFVSVSLEIWSSRWLQVTLLGDSWPVS